MADVIRFNTANSPSDLLISGKGYRDTRGLAMRFCRDGLVDFESPSSARFRNIVAAADSILSQARQTESPDKNFFTDSL